MEIFEPYAHAIASMAGFSVLMLVLGGLSTRGRTAENRAPSGLVKRDYSDPAYRSGRAFMNAVESGAPFAMALLAAMLTGGSPFWVNVFAAVFLLARIATAYVHIATENQAMRSATWAVGFFCILALGLIGLIGAF